MSLMKGYGLLLEEERVQGRYWLVRGDAEPLPSASLSRLELNMMERNAVPGLLAVEAETLNGELHLLYKLPPGRTLTAYIQQASVGKGEVLEILYAVTGIVEDSSRFLLDENKYALIPDWILIGREPGEVRMVYLPIKDLPGKRSVRFELQQLTQFLLDAGGAHGTDTSLLLDCLGSSLFELGEFRRLLVGIMAEGGSAGIIEPTASPPSTRSGAEAPPSYESERKTELDSHWHQAAPVKTRQEADGVRESEDWGMDGDTLRFHPGGWLPSGSRVRVILLSLLLIWCLVAWHPGWTTAAAGAAASAGVLILPRLFAPKPSSIEFPLTDEPGLDFSAYPGKQREEREETTGFRSVDWTAGKDNRSLYADTPAHTVFLLPQQETVELPGETELLLPAAVLEFGEGERKRTVDITKVPFLYGRSPEEVSWVLEGPGISRKHGAISHSEAGEGWTLVDFGSRNGSRLNGVRMEPFKDYPVRDGDRICAAQTEFIFRVR